MTTIQQPPTGPAALFSAATVNRAKVGVYVVFFAAGLAFATWAGRIPTTRDVLGLSPGQLGLLLLAGSAGSLIGLPLAGKIADRIGADRTVMIGSSLVIGSLVLLGGVITFTGSFLLTALSLAVLCFGIGLWDVSMNIHGAEVERFLGHTIMPRFHAAFSFGTVGGALIGAALARFGVGQLWHFTGAAIILVLVVTVGVRAFLPRRELARREHTPPASSTASGGLPAGKTRSAWTEPRVLLIGFVVLVAAFTEGTANDWLAVAFVDGHQLPEWAGIFGLAVFLTFMTIGRVAGTVLLDRFGRVPVLRVTLLLAAAGSLLMIFGNAPLAFVGAAVWGFGVSLGFPVGMSAAADDPRHAAARVSVVSTIGYLAFLAGPPILGFLGDHYGVLRALSAVSLMIVVAFFLLPVMRKPDDVEPATPAADEAPGSKATAPIS